MSKAKSIIAILGILVIVGIGFQNCAEDMDMSAYNQSGGSSDLGSNTDAPVITSAPNSLTLAALSPLSVVITAVGENLTYKWYKNDVLLPAVTGPSFDIVQVQNTDAGNYRVEVINDGGMDSRTFSLNVTGAGTPNPPAITTHVAAQGAIYYTSAEQTYFWFQDRMEDAATKNMAYFSVVASGAGLSYQWYFVDNSTLAETLIPGATAASYSFAVTASAQAGQYKVVVTNPQGAVSSQAALNLIAYNDSMPRPSWLPAASAIESTWVLEYSVCPSGYIDAQIKDDAPSSDNNLHNLTEQSANGTLYKLCVKGITSVYWASACTAGDINGRLQDDNDGKHILGEDSSSGSTLTYCVRGVSAVTWATSCAAGSYWVGDITDDADATHHINEGGNNGAYYRWCFTP